jgi:hypothetical protein
MDAEVEVGVEPARVESGLLGEGIADLVGQFAGETVCTVPSMRARVARLALVAAIDLLADPETLGALDLEIP